MKLYVPSLSVEDVHIQLISLACDVCERKLNGGSVGVKVEKLHDLGSYSREYRPTVCWNVLYSPKSGTWIATGHNQLASV